MFSSTFPVINEQPPIPEQLFGRICRASPEEARELSLSLSAADRAQLALFCNARVHLRYHGRAIADACTRESLMQEGGHAGAMLHAQMKAGPETWGVAPRTGSRRVTLSG